MIDLSLTNEWQHRDEKSGLVFPWYVKSFLDDLKIWDLSDKEVFEYGCGASTLWWAHYAKKVYAVDSSSEYFYSVCNSLDKMNVAEKVKISWCIQKDIYVESINEMPSPRIVIVDGLYRDECCIYALSQMHFNGVLIVDNWMQPSVWMAEEKTQERLLKLKHIIYKQEGHPDWKTAVFYL